MKYKTVEGHDIKSGECYEMRSGGKMFVSTLLRERIYGIREGSLTQREWTNEGREKDGIITMDIVRPYEEKDSAVPYKKVYRLNEMWCGWFFGGKYIYRSLTAFPTRHDALVNMRGNGDRLLAIVHADATEFYEGEGLED